MVMKRIRMAFAIKPVNSPTVGIVGKFPLFVNHFYCARKMGGDGQKNTVVGDKAIGLWVK
jgi:hypothetical protein